MKDDPSFTSDMLIYIIHIKIHHLNFEGNGCAARIAIEKPVQRETRGRCDSFRQTTFIPLLRTPIASYSAGEPNAKSPEPTGFACAAAGDPGIVK